MTRLERIDQVKIWYQEYSKTFSPSMASQLAGESIKLAMDMEMVVKHLQRVQELTKIAPYREACFAIHNYVDKVLQQ